MTPSTLTSRRRFLQGACAIGAASPVLTAVADAKPRGFFAKHNLPIGIQLYTLGDLVTKDLDGTLKAIARTGYGTVELAGYMGKSPADLRKAFDAAGLKCTSAHIGLAKGTPEEPKLFDDLAKVAADMHTIGATQVIAPSLAKPDDINLTPIPGEGFRLLARTTAAMTPDHWKRMADQLSGIGKTLKAEGIAFGYHNHNIEFVKSGGSTGLDLLIAGSDPQYVTFELDVGWVAAAGVDPAAFFAKHRGRFAAMHIKDLKASSVPNVELKMDPTEIGSGKLDWKKILPAGYKAGVRKYFVEQEPPFEKGRLEAAAISYQYLSTLKA
jgi:sugar phosphate isomerase/epimerase